MRSEWAGAFEVSPGYLDTATVGLPPRAAVAAMHADLEAWQAGRLSAAGFDQAVARARQAWAQLVGVPASATAIGAAASQLIGLVAAAVPDGSRVLVAEGDFTSVLFPFLAQTHRGVEVTAVGLPELTDRIDETVGLVAVSLVQSADGTTADLDALQAACAAHGTRLLLDVPQAAG